MVATPDCYSIKPRHSDPYALMSVSAEFATRDVYVSLCICCSMCTVAATTSAQHKDVK